MTSEEIKAGMERYNLTGYYLQKEYGIPKSSTSRILREETAVSAFAAAFFKLLFEKMDNEEGKCPF